MYLFLSKSKKGLVQVASQSRVVPYQEAARQPGQRRGEGKAREGKTRQDKGKKDGAREGEGKAREGKAKKGRGKQRKEEGSNERKREATKGKAGPGEAGQGRGGPVPVQGADQSLPPAGPTAPLLLLPLPGTEGRGHSGDFKQLQKQLRS